MINLPVINKSNNPLPQYQTKQSAGVDLRAFTSEDVMLGPGERVLVGTGLHIALPDGYEAQIRPRSGLAFKHGITIINSPGTIDADYRGEIKIRMSIPEVGSKEYDIGDKIAQLVIIKLPWVDIEEVQDLDDSDRGEGGFGSSGK